MIWVHQGDLKKIHSTKMIIKSRIRSDIALKLDVYTREGHAVKKCNWHESRHAQAHLPEFILFNFVMLQYYSSKQKNFPAIAYLTNS